MAALVAEALALALGAALGAAFAVSLARAGGVAAAADFTARLLFSASWTASARSLKAS